MRSGRARQDRLGLSGYGADHASASLAGHLAEHLPYSTSSSVDQARVGGCQWKGGADEVVRRHSLEHDCGCDTGRHSDRQVDHPVRSSECELRVGSGEVLRRHLVSDLYSGDARADFHHSASTLRPGSERKCDLVETSTLVDLDKVQSCRVNLNQHLSRSGRGLCHLLIAQNLRPAGFMNANGLHVIPEG